MEARFLTRADARYKLLFLSDAKTHVDHRLQVSDSGFGNDICCIALTTTYQDARWDGRLRKTNEINISWPSVTFASCDHLCLYEPTVANSGRKPHLDQENSA